MSVKMLGFILFCSASTAHAQYALPAPGTIASGGPAVSGVPNVTDEGFFRDAATPTMRRQWASRVQMVTAAYPDVLERVRAISGRRERVAYFLDLERQALRRRKAAQE